MHDELEHAGRRKARLEDAHTQKTSEKEGRRKFTLKKYLPD